MHDLTTRPLTIIGPGRLGRALAERLAETGALVRGPFGRNEWPVFDPSDTVLLCVPDREVAAAASGIPAGPLVGHCAGSLTLDALGARDRFSVHPLMTVIDDSAVFRGAAAAIAGSTASARDVARSIALRLGMEPVEIADMDRAAYHASASIASNFLVTLEGAAAQLGATAGLERRHLLPLARAALENWGARGASALTGPIARGDDATVARQRAAVGDRTPELLPLWDAMAEATHSLSSSSHADRGAPASPDRAANRA